MGFEDRDYSSQESWGASAANETQVTKWFVILAVTFFVMQLLTNSLVFFELFSLRVDQAYQGQIWRLVTFAIVNLPDDIVGFIFSLLIVWRFGTDLERMYSSKEIMYFYSVMIAFVGGAFAFWGLFIPLRMPLFGSFTVALGLMALFATHFPRMEVYILPLISIQLRWLVALYALFGAYPGLRVIQQGGGLAGVAVASPVLSILFAYLYRKYNWHLSRISSVFDLGAIRRSLRNRFARKRLKVFKPSTDVVDWESKVDALLAKIHEHGSESLTDDERAILVRASERMKNRS